MDYYERKQYIPQVDRNDNVLGGVERWQAHREGILHRGFTIVLIHKDSVILQHRKHPVFDGYFDLSCSSHPLFLNGQLQGIDKAVYDTLYREWSLGEQEIQSVLHKGSVYYKANDPSSRYQEHEICHLYEARIKRPPKPNYDYMYGFSYISREQALDKKFAVQKALAPWVTNLASLDREILR